MRTPKSSSTTNTTDFFTNAPLFIVVGAVFQLEICYHISNESSTSKSEKASSASLAAWIARFLGLLQRKDTMYRVSSKVWQPDWIECSSKEDRRDAMRVATFGRAIHYS